MRPLAHLWDLLRSLKVETGYLIEIETAVPIRVSSFGNVSWNGELWADRMLAVSGMSRNDSAPYAPSASISLLDSDYSVTASMLRDGIVGCKVRVWRVVAHDLNAATPVLCMEAFADAMSNSKGTVKLTVVPDDGAHLMAPRERISSQDYPYLIAPGSVVKFGNGQITLMGTRL
ncbi:MAG: hypothetical protein LBB65_06335 [Burkholderiales bacterium]|jgi:hypothetical protein|nr:hypothetical protein [Burkholderiales bacterium]